MDARKFLESLAPTREQVDAFLAGGKGPDNYSCNAGWTFDAELGWILCDSIRDRSVDGSKGFYHYETDGARRVINGAGEPCRLNTFGNSFTHCDQVSDGETWQEYLAAHLREPIRNYGVGGYSVYQAFRRMKRVESNGGAPYVILNIWDDDHFRSLDAWRTIRFGNRTFCGYTLPHLRVDPDSGTVKEIENVCQSAEDVYKLCDRDFVWETFKDDYVLKLIEASDADVARRPVKGHQIPIGHGLGHFRVKDRETADRIQKIHSEAALLSTCRVIEMAEEFLSKRNKRLMIVLTFNRARITDELLGRPRFDQQLVDWLALRETPSLDMRDAFLADFKQFGGGDAKAYLDRFYIGHHSPAGNFFAAWALKDRLVGWLDPKPLPYR